MQKHQKQALPWSDVKDLPSLQIRRSLESAGVSPSEKAYLFSSFPSLLLSRWARPARQGGGGWALVVRPCSPGHQVLQTSSVRRSSPSLSVLEYETPRHSGCQGKRLSQSKYPNGSDLFEKEQITFSTYLEMILALIQLQYPFIWAFTSKKCQTN